MSHYTFGRKYGQAPPPSLFFKRPQTTSKLFAVSFISDRLRQNPLLKYRRFCRSLSVLIKYLLTGLFTKPVFDEICRIFPIPVRIMLAYPLTAPQKWKAVHLYIFECITRSRHSAYINFFPRIFLPCKPPAGLPVMITPKEQRKGVNT